MPYCIYDNRRDSNKGAVPGLDMQLVISNIFPHGRQSILPEHLIEYLKAGLVEELCFYGVDFSESFAGIELIYMPQFLKDKSRQTQKKINLLDIVSSTKRKINLFFKNCSLPEKFITETIKLKARNPLISTEFEDDFNMDKDSNNFASDALSDTSSESSDLDSESYDSLEDKTDDESAFSDSENDNSPQAVSPEYRVLDKTKGWDGFSMFSRSNWSGERSRNGSSAEGIDPVKSAKEKAWIERYYKTDEDKAKFVPPLLPTAFSLSEDEKDRDDELSKEEDKNDLSPSKRKKK